MARYIGGLCVLEPGYKKFLVRPHIMPELSYVDMAKEIPYGKAAISWRRIERMIAVHVEVPVNTQAVVSLPGMDEQTVGSGMYDYLIKESGLE